MRPLTKPISTFYDVFDLCIEGVGRAALKTNYENVRDVLNQDVSDYNALATQGDLWKIRPNNQSKDAIVVGDVTKKQLKDLYSNYLAAEGKPGRAIYDGLMASAPLEMCPYCGVGRVSTLDHYLPKSKFPRLSIVVENLIPACKDCNMGTKGTAVALNAESQPIHPYYEGVDFNSAQWLFCEVLQTNPATVTYHANPPENWSSIYKKRVEAHLKSFDLNARFSFQAAEELSHIRQTFIQYYQNLPANARRDYLAQLETAEYALRPNSWKRAMYQALSSSHWYCDGGYL